MSAEQTLALPLLNTTDAPMPSVCCAAAMTYGTGAIPPGLTDDVPGVAETDPRALGIDLVDGLFPTARYHWRYQAETFVNPSAFTDGLDSFYASMAIHNCPASVLVRLQDAVLARSVIYVAASTAPTIVYETFRPNDRAAVQTLSRAELTTADTTRFADPDWQNFFVGSAGSSNYGHWLVDDLPRLKAVSALMRMSPRPVRILIHSYGPAIDQIRMESIRVLLGAAVHIDLLDPDTPYGFSELYYATPVSQHPVQKSPVALEFAARKVLSPAVDDGEGQASSTLLFVDRAPRYGRNLSNGDSIRKLVERRGFTTIDPETMSFVEQVRAFASAQVVIGYMGAAMTNTLFCRPTTTLIYLAPSGWIEPFYLDLSIVRGQYYRVIFGDVTNCSVPPHLSNFTVDPGVLEQAIDAL